MCKIVDICILNMDLTIEKTQMQYCLNNLQGRSARLDIYAVDSNGTNYDIEIQRADSGAVSKRARYNSALLDANISNPGDKYQNLLETYVIFITENDVFGAGLPVYTIERKILEIDKMFNDRAHIMYVNSKIQNKTKLGEIMHDFWCVNPDEMYNETLRNRVRYLKNTNKGVDSMCEIISESYKKLELENAEKMLKDNLSYEKIEEYTHLTLSEINELAKKIKN